MDQNILETVCALRAELNRLAERSGEEKRTKAHLMRFLGENTSLRLEDGGRWFCAVHEEQRARETVAFRAEMDALPFGEGAAHLCGHDGHCAVLADWDSILKSGNSAGTSYSCFSTPRKTARAEGSVQRRLKNAGSIASTRSITFRDGRRAPCCCAGGPLPAPPAG